MPISLFKRPYKPKIGDSVKFIHPVSKDVVRGEIIGIEGKYASVYHCGTIYKIRHSLIFKFL